MWMKRNYKPNSTVVDHVEIKHLSKLWRPSVELVAKALEDGWMQWKDGNLVVKTDQGDLAYKVLFRPGKYCCHCGHDLAKEHPKQHLERAHYGKLSPDRNNPSGYRVLHSYEVQLIEDRSWLERLFGG